MKPSDQAAKHVVTCRACVGSTGLSDAHRRRHEKQNSLLVASMDYGFFTDGDDGEHTRRATPFLVVKVKPNMMIWSMLVQCKGVEAQATIKETVESSNRVAYPELILRSDTFVTLLKERFGVRGIAQAPPKYDSASVGMVENAIKQGKEKVRTLVIATRWLRGVVMDLEHVALAWCVRFAGQIISRTVQGADGLSHSNVHFRVRLTDEPCLQHGEKRSCTWKRARRRFRSQTSFWTVSSWASKKVLRSSLWEHLLVVWYAELSKDGLVKTLQIRFFSTASVETPRRWLPDDEAREPREPREQPLRTDVRPVHTDFPPPINTEPAKPRRVHQKLSRIGSIRVHSWMHWL